MNEKARAELINELKESLLIDGLEYDSSYGQIADFIIERDRKRDRKIVEPLVVLEYVAAAETPNNRFLVSSGNDITKAVFQTLKNAGVEL